MKYFIVYIMVVFWSLDAYAQSLPGSADASRIKPELKDYNVFQNINIKKTKEIFIDDVIPKAEDGFMLKGIIFDGLTAFDQSEFDDLINEYINKEADLNVLNHLASRITSLYKSKGYLLSRAFIPSQGIKDNVVKIQIIEAYVNNIIIDDPDNIIDKDFTNLTKVMTFLIKKMKPLQADSLERYMLLFNKGPRLSVQSILKPATDVENLGAIDIVLKFKEKAPSGSIGYNNYGSRYIGPHQIEMAYVTGGIISPYDSLSYKISSSVPIKEMQYGQISYSVPITPSGISLNSSASYTHSKPGLSLKDLEVESRSMSFNAGVNYPVILSRRTNFVVGTEFSIRNSSTEFLDKELIDDKVRSVNIYADFHRYDSLRGENRMFLSMYKGLDVMGATKTGTPNLSRSQGRSDFFKATLSMSRTQELENNLSLLTQLQGQYAPHPLLSSEEFGYGGKTYGRSYDASEISGDSGISAGVELRYRGVKNLYGLDLMPYGFYDIGKVWNKDLNSKPSSGASSGFGLYYQYGDNLTGATSLAFPLTKQIDTPIINGKDGPRFLFRINSSF